jgi:hypothetical protein
MHSTYPGKSSRTRRTALAALTVIGVRAWSSARRQTVSPAATEPALTG